MAWISVNDELPGCAEDVLCYCPKNGVICVAWWDYKKEGGIFWTDGPYWSERYDVDSEHYFLCDGEEVTHWMPLPEPPENTKE